jgi:hypothetical protein
MAIALEMSRVVRCGKIEWHGMTAENVGGKLYDKQRLRRKEVLMVV